MGALIAIGCIGLFGVVCWLVLLRERRAMSSPAPADRPWDCPHCGGRLVRALDSYVCEGLRDRAEVEEYMGKDTPKNVRATLPCGWKGLATRYGKGWA